MARNYNNRNDDFAVPSHIYETEGGARYFITTIHIPIPSKNVVLKRKVLVNLTDVNAKNGEVKKTKNGNEVVIVGTALVKPKAYYETESKRNSKQSNKVLR